MVSFKSSLSETEDRKRIQQLERIDQLRSLGVGDEIKLPQLVVVGDQSSGKSSVLEGISGIPFPIGSQLCTRFATQIVFRRIATPESQITVSILPAPTATEFHAKKLSAFMKVVEDLNATNFGQILQQATVCMGLPGIDNKPSESESRFSDDVLKIELAGPNQDHFSVVDVPGLFHNPTKTQTQEDKDLVRRLIRSYVADRRTIIMAVMDSGHNFANQGVFQMAKNADADGMRTVGIMTKCDLVQEGDKETAISIAQNQTHPLRHGWYCVRNRNPEEIQASFTMEQRHKAESDFFATAPWKTLDRTRVGVSALKQALSALLSDHVANEFPTITEEIEVNLQRYRLELKALGPPRQTPHEQLQYLIKVAGEFQREVEDSLAGRYQNTSRNVSKLRMHVQNAGLDFAKLMHGTGHTLHFRSPEDDYDDDEADLDYVEKIEDEDKDEDEDEDDDDVDDDGDKVDSNRASITSVFEGNLDGIDEDIERGPSRLYEVIRVYYRNSRGRELPGHVNPSVLENLFEYQTKNWQRIAKIHLDRVIASTAACLDDLFVAVVPDTTIRTRIKEHIATDMTNARDGAKAQLNIILNDERSGPLLTDNHYFADNLAAARAQRVVASLKKAGFEDGKQFTMNFNTMTSASHLSNEASAIHDIHDTLQAYYKVALKRFIDNVKVQVVERCLFGSTGMTSVFTTDYVSRLLPAELENLVGEDFNTSTTRTTLQMQIERMEQAKKICVGKA